MQTATAGKPCWACCIPKLTVQMLTGKAKAHFENWSRHHPALRGKTTSMDWKIENFSEWPVAIQQAFLLEWLDSVGIYVSVIPVVRATEYYYFSEVTSRRYRRVTCWSSGPCPTRELATAVAIIQAAAIYNGNTG